MLLSWLRDHYVAEGFEPGLPGLCTNPFYIARAGLHHAIRRHAPAVGGRILDVGCGTAPYRKMFDESQYVGLEIDTPETRRSGVADYFFDGRTFPFENEAFDSAVCNQVLEHVFDPENFLQEIHRVLRRDGVLLLTVPFCWDEHEQPNDYARYSSYGVRHLLEKNGFLVIEHEKSVDDVSVLFQLFNCYIYKKLNPKNVYLNLLFSLMVYFPVTSAGLLLSRVLPGNPDLYLDNVLLLRKTS